MEDFLRPQQCLALLLIFGSIDTVANAFASSTRQCCRDYRLHFNTIIQHCSPQRISKSTAAHTNDFTVLPNRQAILPGEGPLWDFATPTVRGRGRSNGALQIYDKSSFCRIRTYWSETASRNCCVVRLASCTRSHLSNARRTPSVLYNLYHPLCTQIASDLKS